MKILVTGASGLIGSELVPVLTKQGHDVYCLSRSKPREARDITWDPDRGQLPKARLEGTDVVVHLAGENIVQKRWSPKFKETLRQSRVAGTRLISETLAALDAPPKAFICASAIGYYGDRGSELLNETSPMGTGFLPDLCRDWEAACEPARAKGIRVVNLRIGVVLSPKGGALTKMLTPFKLGLGGVIGSGHQYWSWVTSDDVVGAINHCIVHDRMSGPVNVTAPCPVTNYEFTKTLGTVLNRPTLFPMPGFAARLALGEMADGLLLASARVMPNRLNEANYQFVYPSLEPALKHLLS